MSDNENQETDFAQYYPGIEWNGQSLEIKGKFWYKIETKRGAVDSVITRIRIWDFVPLLASRGLPFVIKLERNDAKIFR